jgi:hypothetical protein
VDLAHGPLHVRPERAAELGVAGKAGVVRRLDETGDEAVPQIVVGDHPGMTAQHPRLTLGHLAVERGSAEDLGPVAGQSLDVPRMPGVGERMVQHRVRQAPFVVRGGQRQERRLAAGELEDGRA